MNKSKAKLKSRIKQLEKQIRETKDFASNHLRLNFEVTINGSEISIYSVSQATIPQYIRSYVPDTEWLKVVEPAVLNVQALVHIERRSVEEIEISNKDLLPAWKKEICQKVCKSLQNAIEQKLISIY